MRLRSTLKRILLVAVAGVIAGLAVLGWGWTQWTQPMSGPLSGKANSPNPVKIRIIHGMTLSAATDTLVARGLLKHRQIMLLGARFTGQGRGLKAGLYEIHGAIAPRELLSQLTGGITVQVVLTIPEGLDSDEILTIVTRVFPFRATEFLSLADSMARAAIVNNGLMADTAAVQSHDKLMLASNPRTLHWSEGMLAPDTYHFAEGSTAEMVLTVLIQTQLSRLAVAQAQTGFADRSAYALLTLASIVESEAKVDAERARIAAVYTNRLHKGWRLEADPTVAFILDKKGDRLFFKHLKIDSPYNTYLTRGLPPGPIGTPGSASLKAAAVPDATCDALYFVSDGAQLHVFSRTLAEHEAAVQAFRAARRAQ